MERESFSPEQNAEETESAMFSLEQSIGMLNAQAGDRMNVEVKRRAIEILGELKTAEGEQKAGLLNELEEELGKYEATDGMDDESKRAAMRLVREMKGE